MEEAAAAKVRPVTQEIATSGDGRDITKPFQGPLALSEDSVLKSLGQRWEVYREIRRDGQVHATFQQRRLAIVGRPLIVEPGRDDRNSRKAAEHLQANLDAIAFDRATKGMSWGFFYGFSVGECMWTVRDDKVWLDQVKVRTPWRFRFTPAGELRLLTLKNTWSGEELPARKFWVMASGADNDDESYGLGLGHQLHWPVYFKKQGLAFWLRALEKFGGPSVVGKYPPGTPPEEQTKLLAAAQALRVDGAVIIPDGMMLDLLEATRGTVDQSTFLRQMNAEISKIVIGQTMTTDDGSSLAQGKVHQDVKEEVTDADVEELCESFEQGPARWLTEWNFPGAATPKLRRPSPEDDERVSKLAKERAETVKIMGEAGFEPEPDRVGEMYPGWRRKPEPAATPQALPPEPEPTAAAAGNPEPAFAARDPDIDPVDAFVDELDWEPLVAPIVAEVEALVAAAPDLVTAAARLAEIFTSGADSAFAEHLGRALFEARLAAEAGVTPREPGDGA
jgi:phage gp29-like protein